jgi:hypothetical protein
VSVKYKQQYEQLRRSGVANSDVYFNRVAVDGIPFRGQAPLLKSSEAEERLTQVNDAKNGTFYTGDPVQNAAYLEVVDRIANSWYQLIFVDRWRNDGDNHHYVYIEWVERYMQDTRPQLS